MYRFLTLTIPAFVLITLPSIADEKPAPAEKAAVKAVAKGNNEFAFDLYRQLAKEAKPEENIFFSPYSISAALAMTYAGARGETAEQMAQVLRFGRDQDKFHPAFAQLSQQIRTPGEEFKGEINIANAIWANQGLTVREQFQQVMNRHYEAGLRMVDFDQGEAARQRINGWVAEQTKEKIKQLLPSGALNRDTTMVLTNAIYFQADWLVAFDKEKTKEEKFFRTPTEAVTVPMMHLETRLRYAKTDDLEIVELPYAGKQFSMIILLPTSHEKLGVVEQGVARWDDWMGKLRPREVVLAMPKVSLTQKFRLKDSLKAMGLTNPFSRLADFSGIGSGFGHIGAVYHHATLEVEESGTTAAAATAVPLQLGALRPPPVEVTINRPFLVAVRDTKQGEILFLGQVMLPSVK